jgi:hypothetical protein
LVSAPGQLPNQASQLGIQVPWILAQAGAWGRNEQATT